MPFPTRSLSRDEERRFRNGQAVQAVSIAAGTTRALDEQGRLVGLGVVFENMLRPTVVLPPA
ncbi:MAG: tRNA pseudouridine(55) synthase TruB [Acidobacteriota bacterium]